VVPVVADDNWSRNPIDAFVLQRLRDVDLTPAPQASRAALVRRLYFDLIGLPPTPQEIEVYVRDTSPDPWNALVDRLLADPRYGEHWGRFWLDVVRYAESDGWKKDSYRPHIWRYRDYVVQSFNEDKPYPAFVREQLAGDEIGEDHPAHLVATGFLRLGIYEYNQRNARPHWNDIMNEITDVTGDVFLGLSMSCSRCHDHKFDPIPQTDYFSLRAFFEPLIWRDDLPGATQAEQDAWRKEMNAWEAAAADELAEIAALCEPFYEDKRVITAEKFPLDIQASYHKPEEARTSWDQQMAYLVMRQFEEEGEPALKKMTDEEKQQLKALETRLAEHDAIKPDPLPVVLAATDFPGTISPTLLETRGTERAVSPSFLSALSRDSESATPQLDELPGSSGRRTALAEWIGKPDNPLTTRVIVNRIWQQHFGQGIVASSGDFGRMGTPPSHPELLDWLATTFVENGWSMKRLHKLIVLSATWRQSTNHPQAEEQLAKNPTGSLLWRARLRRLSAEQVRDAMLAATGELDPTPGGPSVDADVPRRALYVKRFRNTQNAMLEAFDVANGLCSVPQRNLTTSPTQALLMLNGDYTLARAEKLAEHVEALGSDTPENVVADTFQLAWGRTPTDVELTDALAMAARLTGEEAGGISAAGLRDLCHVLLNANEFLYVD
jgi:hypothetical protein